MNQSLSLIKPVALIGFQASGKTTLGRLLADALHCSFIDTDQLIEQFHPPHSVREIHQIFGEDLFREIETKLIDELKFSTPFILATGGGSLLQPRNGKKLKEQSILIYLKTSPEIIKERIWERPSLPTYLSSNHLSSSKISPSNLSSSNLSENNPHQAFQRIFNERIALYEKWADVTVEMDGLNQEQALSLILIHLTHFI